MYKICISSYLNMIMLSLTIKIHTWIYVYISYELMFLDMSCKINPPPQKKSQKVFRKKCVFDHCNPSFPSSRDLKNNKRNSSVQVAKLEKEKIGIKHKYCWTPCTPSSRAPLPFCETPCRRWSSRRSCRACGAPSAAAGCQAGQSSRRTGRI